MSPLLPRLASFVFVATWSFGCSGAEFSKGEPAADAAAPNGPQDTGTPLDTGVPDAARETAPPAPVELNLVVANDTDDATWIDGTDERLHFSETDLAVEVGVDAEMGRVGFRFLLPVPRGSTIASAHLRLRRVSGDATETETMQVQVFDTANVAPFDETHVHAPAGHASVWPATVSGFLVGTNGKDLESPDLKSLVQHVSDAPDESEMRTIGFVLSPDRMATWVSFADSSGNQGAAALRVVYTPP
jgi:hypothetical protein